MDDCSAASLGSQYQWKNRVVLVCGAPSLEGQRQLKLLRADVAALEEREVLIVERDGKRFEVRLIGKDGGEKARWTRPVPPTEIWKKIDAMPMRREEMRGPK